MVVGIALAILGSVVVLLGESGKRVKQPKHAATVVCGNCQASFLEDALSCPSCGVEFGEAS